MHRRCLKRSKNSQEKRWHSPRVEVVMSHSVGGFGFLCLLLQTLITGFYFFYNFFFLLLPHILLLFWKTAFKLKGFFFLYFFLPTFFPIKPENEQGRRTSLEKFTRSVVSSFSFPSSLSSELHFSLGGMRMLNLLHLLFLQIASLQLLF